MKSIEGQFVDWLRTKDPAETYSYVEPNHCAVAQFGQEMGYQFDALDSDDLISRFGASFEDALVELPETFGALLERMEAKVPA